MATNVQDVHILLVNQNPDNRRILAETLRTAGFRHLTETADGRNAARVLRRERIDLLITDVEIAPLDGWRLGRMVRSGIFLCDASIPLILVATTWCERIAETTAREFGFDAVIPLERSYPSP